MIIMIWRRRHFNMGPCHSFRLGQEAVIPRISVTPSKRREGSTMLAIPRQCLRLLSDRHHDLEITKYMGMERHQKA